MNRTLVLAALLAVALGCEAADRPAPSPPADTPKADAPKPGEVKKTPLDEQKTLFMESFPDGKKRVLIETEVCLREGPLELLMCRKQTKEHESILHTTANAQLIHGALMAIKAKPGSPIKYEPKLTPPSGTSIKISLQYKKKDETVTVDAKEWVRNAKTRKALDVDWVFAGSALFQDPDNPKKPPFYMANGGDM